MRRNLVIIFEEAQPRAEDHGSAVLLTLESCSPDTQLRVGTCPMGFSEDRSLSGARPADGSLFGEVLRASSACERAYPRPHSRLRRLATRRRHGRPPRRSQHDSAGPGDVQSCAQLGLPEVRWTQSSPDEIADFRRSLLKASKTTFVELMKLMATEDYCSPELLRAIARMPALQARMKDVGFVPPPPDDPKRFNPVRPTRSREVLKKFGVEIPEPRKAPASPVPRSVWVGAGNANGQEIRVDRAQVFERVWSQPFARLAAEWGPSGPGLKKVCCKLNVPVPPRGYCAKLAAGHRARRPHLPTLPADVAPEIIVRVPPNPKRDETSRPTALRVAPPGLEPGLS
jgi:hypothetical protein